MSKLTVRFRVLPDGPTLTVTGRDAWALLALVASGARGATPIENPGPRWSAYVFNLRQLGLTIETVRERHRGAFPGSHARYVLRSPVEVLTPMEALPADAA